MSISPAQGVSSQVPVTNADKPHIVRTPQAEQRTGEVSPAQQRPARDTSKVDAVKEEARVKNATHLLNEFMKRASIALQFSTDSDSGQVVVKVVSKQTGELIRQIPSELALKLSKAADTLQGLIIQEKA